MTLRLKCLPRQEQPKFQAVHSSIVSPVCLPVMMPCERVHSMEDTVKSMEKSKHEAPQTNFAHSGEAVMCAVHHLRARVQLLEDQAAQWATFGPLLEPLADADQRRQEEFDRLKSSVQSTDRDLREEFGKVLSMVKEKGDHGSNFDRLEYRLATLEDRLGTDLPPGVSQQDQKLCGSSAEYTSVAGPSVEKMSSLEKEVRGMADALSHATSAEKRLEQQINDAYSDLRSWLSKLARDQDGKHLLASKKNLDNLEAATSLLSAENARFREEATAQHRELQVALTRCNDDVAAAMKRVDAASSAQERVIQDLRRRVDEKDLDTANRVLELHTDFTNLADQWSRQSQQTEILVDGRVKHFEAKLAKEAQGAVEQAFSTVWDSYARGLEANVSQELDSRAKKISREVAAAAVVLNGDLAKTAEQCENKRQEDSASWEPCLPNLQSDQATRVQALRENISKASPRGGENQDVNIPIKAAAPRLPQQTLGSALTASPPKGSPRTSSPPKGSPRHASTASPRHASTASTPKGNPRAASPPRGSPRTASPPRGNPRTASPPRAAGLRTPKDGGLCRQCR